MNKLLLDWRKEGFSRTPELRVAPDTGLTLYRCWGGTSAEFSSFFSVEKAVSVYDAEMRFNIADFGNQIMFVSTFLLKGGEPYWIGPVFHRKTDISLPAEQVFVEPPVTGKVSIVQSKQVLKQDAFVSPRTGHA